MDRARPRNCFYVILPPEGFKRDLCAGKLRLGNFLFHVNVALSVSHIILNHDSPAAKWLTDATTCCFDMQYLFQTCIVFSGR